MKNLIYIPVVKDKIIVPSRTPSNFSKQTNERITDITTTDTSNATFVKPNSLDNLSAITFIRPSPGNNIKFCLS